MTARRLRRRATAVGGMHARRVPPRVHWIALTLVLLTVAAALLLQGYAQHEVGEAGTSHPEGPSGTVPQAILHGGPVIDTRGDQARSAAASPGTVALTFDDGPDPTWTPQILDVLRRHHVPATFFVIGAHAAENPGLVRDELAEGSEVGLHTFTHTDLASVPGWRQRLEIEETQLALAGGAGVTSSLLRPPYSSTPLALDDAEWAAVRAAGQLGYLTVLADRDSEDWERPGIGQIIANATPPTGTGAVVLFHDGGGDRSQTVAALDQLITRLQAQGFRFATVTAAVGIPTAVVAASAGEHWRGYALLWALRGSDWLVTALSWLIVVVAVLTVLRVLALLAAAVAHARRRGGRSWGPPVTVPVSVIVPAYNEEVGIEATVRSVLASNYPWLEVIVVDDGSTDRTAEIVQRLALPGVRLVRQANAGKPAALNTGIAHARAEILVLVDGDTVFEPDTVRTLVQPFADQRVGAVSGNAKVANRGGILGRWQHIEYVVGFNLDRRLFDLGECMPTVPGAIGAFRRSALAEVGGLSGATLAEDTDLTMALCRVSWRVVYEPNARAWTEAPATLGQLWRQRYRWCYGTLQAMWKHRSALRQRGAAGKLGRRGLVYLALFQTLLPLLAPVIDVYSLYGLVFLDSAHVALIWLAFLFVQAVTAAVAFRLDRERFGPLWTLPLQQIVYRQLMYLVVIQSVITAIAGARLRWHKLDRQGVHAPPTPTAGNVS